MECGVRLNEIGDRNRCLFYEFITRETLVQCKQGECEYDVLIKLFKILGYPGVSFWRVIYE